MGRREGGCANKVKVVGLFCHARRGSFRAKKELVLAHKLSGAQQLRIETAAAAGDLPYISLGIRSAAASLMILRVLVYWVFLSLLLHLPWAWKSDRRPRIYGEKVAWKLIDPGNKQVMRKIVIHHNYFRSRVDPPAADMLAMTYHKKAAMDAQRWAEACRLLTHDNVTGRWVEAFGSCGQNIFVSTHKVPWFFAIKTWFLEKMNFTYGSANNDLFVIGHYTQMVWAATHKVGCGLAKCDDGRSRPFYNYVCNYCPIGNYNERLGRPYKKGAPCSGCRDHCKYKKLCSNSCPFADLWVNCQELNVTWHDWLCNKALSDQEGQQRLSYCRATCRCHDKIV